MIEAILIGLVIFIAAFTGGAVYGAYLVSDSLKRDVEMMGMFRINDDAYKAERLNT